MKAVTSIQKQTPTLNTIDVQDNEKAVIVTEDDEVTLTVNGIGNLFQDTSSEELSNE